MAPLCYEIRVPGNMVSIKPFRDNWRPVQIANTDQLYLYLCVLQNVYRTKNIFQLHDYQKFIDETEVPFLNVSLWVFRTKAHTPYVQNFSISRNRFRNYWNSIDFYFAHKSTAYHTWSISLEETFLQPPFPPIHKIISPYKV